MSTQGRLETYQRQLNKIQLHFIHAPAKYTQTDSEVLEHTRHDQLIPLTVHKALKVINKKDTKIPHLLPYQEIKSSMLRNDHKAIDRVVNTASEGNNMQASVKTLANSGVPAEVSILQDSVKTLASLEVQAVC